MLVGTVGSSVVGGPNKEFTLGFCFALNLPKSFGLKSQYSILGFLLAIEQINCLGSQSPPIALQLFSLNLMALPNLKKPIFFTFSFKTF